MQSRFVNDKSENAPPGIQKSRRALTLRTQLCFCYGYASVCGFAKNASASITGTALMIG